MFGSAHWYVGNHWSRDEVGIYPILAVLDLASNRRSMSGLLTHRVLVVDDSAEDVELLLLAFKRAAVSALVDAVYTAKGAINYIATTAALPTLVMLDLNLPDMPGFEVLRLLRQDPRLNEVPILVFTNLERTGDLERALSLGATSFRAKPLSLCEFVQDVEAIRDTWLSV
jgi:CheY-like chemotaxis protein